MQSFDLLIVGGGINGCAIARDAAARGARVLLVEKDDLAAHTSSASSKLIHGGLRYLEYGELRLVSEALRERSILLRTAPHIVRPLAFVLPHARGMRPWWMVRSGLLLYDLLSLGGGLPRSRSTGERRFAEPLQEQAGARLALYWDAWVDDARLAVLNAVDAAERGAEIATRTEFISARRDGEVWRAKLSGGREVTAKAVVNAAGAWVGPVLEERLGEPGRSKARLVKGSHIVVPRLFEGAHAYILQQPDGRVVFALPFHSWTLVGTTDVPVAGPAEAKVEAQEIEYLCAAVNRYFRQGTEPADIVWSYSGIRSLFEDGREDARAVTRDYRLELAGAPGPKLLSVFGGKITTARALAEEALDRLRIGGPKVTARAPLPGGEAGSEAMSADLATWLPPPLLARLGRAYGSRLRGMIGSARSVDALGRHFGAGLYEAELRYLIDREFARTAEDVLWRRTKLGLHIDEAERQGLARWMDRYGPS